MITVHLLTKNNEATLQACLESVQPFVSQIVIGDFGSTDNTLSIAKQYDAKIIHLKWRHDLSQSRNELLKHCTNDWQMYLEPWEEVISTELEDLSGDGYKVYHLQGEMLMKETRLWRKGTKSFQRPVYESLEPEADEHINFYIRGEAPNQSIRNWEILERWANQRGQMAADVHYYLACWHLVNNDYPKFMTEANSFLFRRKEGMSVYMTRYYLAQVKYKVYHETSEAIMNILHCLSYSPAMAELWCLLGDIFMYLKQYQRAKEFYENALLFGSQRKYSDAYPVEIPKYKEYPQKMLQALGSL